MKKKLASGIIIFIVLIVVIIGVVVYSCLKPANEVSFDFSSGATKTYTAGEADSSETKLYKNDFIAALYIEGQITEANNTYNQKWLMDTVKKLTYNNKNVALAIYINSPGGAVYQADELYLALQEYKAITGRPIYVYQGPMAASGGYYLSCAAEEIYANRNTLTGCIGVIMGNSFDLTGLFEKMGIKSTTIHTGRNKNMGNYNEPFNEEQQAIMQSMCDECYEQFVSIVAHSRHLQYDKAVELSDGRLYTAKQALENGLIDKIDSWDHMLEDLANKIEKPGIKVNTYKYERKKQSMFDMLYGKAKDLETAKAASALGIPVTVMEDINNSSMMPMYLAPACN